MKLYTDGKRVAGGDIPASLAMLYSVDEGCDVGEDSFSHPSSNRRKGCAVVMMRPERKRQDAQR